MDSESQEEREARTRSLWRELDTHDQGFLDAKALKKGLKKIDHPLKHADSLLEDVLEAADINNDGRVSFEEFRRFMTGTEQELWSLFQSIDKNHDGKLDKGELQSAVLKAGLAVPNSRLDRFFDEVDTNNDGVISFDEWRDFLLFLPNPSPDLKGVLSYYQATVRVTAEGDTSLSDETVQGIGTAAVSFFQFLFGAITQIAKPPVPAIVGQESIPPPPIANEEMMPKKIDELPSQSEVEQSHSQNTSRTSFSIRSVLTEFVPDPGYFIAGGLSGVASRTTTAPLDRLKVYLIAQTSTADEAVQAAKSGAAVKATKKGMHTLAEACKHLWAAGGMRSLFAGNGLNVLKVMPESAVKFGSYEAAKRAVAKIEGHSNTKKISPYSQFVAGGVAGMISQAVVYPLDTLKFRMQCETVPGGLHGNKLIISTAKKMWTTNGIFSFYRGLQMGLVGMFPYAAIDLGTFEYLKRAVTAYNVKKYGGHEDDCAPSSFATALMGGFSGAFGASAVYPLNLLRTRLQSQGTAGHPRTYTGIVDVTRQTIKGEGVRGLFKGLTPNLLKVVPAVSITYVVYENTKKALHLN